jgi:hypothetical protein
VLPGKYSLSIAIPGIVQPLRGAITVEADPMDAVFTAAQRRERQAMLLDVYALQRTLGEARRASRTLSGQTTAMRQSLGRGGSAGTSKADVLADRIEKLQAEVDRLIGYTGSLMRSIDGFNARPTADRGQQLAWARADAIEAITAMNRLTQTELPQAYAQHAPGDKAPNVPSITPPAKPESRP